MEVPQEGNNWLERRMRLRSPLSSIQIDSLLHYIAGRGKRSFWRAMHGIWRQNASLVPTTTFGGKFYLSIYIHDDRSNTFSSTTQPPTCVTWRLFTSPPWRSSSWTTATTRSCLVWTLLTWPRLTTLTSPTTAPATRRHVLYVLFLSYKSIIDCTYSSCQPVHSHGLVIL